MAKNTKLPKRNEVEKQFTWAIEDLYASDEQWQKEFDQVKALLPKLAEYQGRLEKSGEILLSFLRLSDEVGRTMERVYVYANQKYHEDTGNAVYQDLSNKANMLSVQVNSSMAFATPEILAIPEETLVQFKAENEELKLYDFYLKDILRLKPHILSAEMESLLADAGEIAEAGKASSRCSTMRMSNFPRLRMRMVSRSESPTEDMGNS